MDLVEKKRDVPIVDERIHGCFLGGRLPLSMSDAILQRPSAPRRSVSVNLPSSGSPAFHE